MVMTEVPTVALLPTVTFIVDVPEPGAAIDVVLKDTVTFDGRPDADKETAELKLPEAAVVTVEEPELLLCTVIAVGDALMEKSALAGVVTVRVTVAVCVMPPPVPVTVIG